MCDKCEDFYYCVECGEGNLDFKLLRKSTNMGARKSLIEEKVFKRNVWKVKSEMNQKLYSRKMYDFDDKDYDKLSFELNVLQTLIHPCIYPIDQVY